MASQAIGSLFVALGLDTAAFTAGVKQVQGKLTGLAAGMTGKVGKSATDLGEKLSVVSAGMAALGAAALGIVNTTAQAGVEIDRQARIANASAREFQLMAAGAKKVGIEQDKLSDILKDVNDRVGEFNQTGGGPMKDFFENIAPKVGITADAFKGLSGPQALQLYISSLERAGVSQQEMTFYLEAMASDSTALLPLLRNNGAEMARLGAAADATGAIMSDKAIAASKGFMAEMDRLKSGAVGLRNGLAESLLPAFTSFLQLVNEQIVPALGVFIGKVGEVVAWFGTLPGPVQEAVGVIAAALGVGGPVLLAVGAFATALSGLIAAAGPVGLFIAAASLLATAWMVWGDDIKTMIASVAQWFSEKFAQISGFVRDNAETIKLALVGPIGWAMLAWRKWGDDIKALVGQALDAVKAKFDELLAWMQALPGKMLEIGDQIVQGLIDGITRKWEDLKAQVYAMAESLPQWAREALGIHSPSRVFRDIGMWVMKGLGLGVRENVPEVEGAMQAATDAVAGADMETPLYSFRDAARGVFSQVALEGKRLGDVLKDMAGSWLSNTASNLFASGFNALWGGLGLPAFANGAQSFAGGLARVNERGGEIMNLPKGTQVIPHDISKRMADRAAGGMGSLAISVAVDEGGGLQAFVRNQAGQIVAQSQPATVKRAVQATGRAMSSTKKFGRIV